MKANFLHLHVRSVFKYSLFPAAFLILFLSGTRASETIWNEYSAITQVFNADTTDLDSVRVSDPGIFSVGDTVMFIQMKGAEVYLPPDTRFGKIRTETVYNTGLYVLLLVSDIFGDIIQFSDPLPYMKSPIPGEVNQLVRVRGARTIEIPAGDTLTCEPWNPADSTGGVVVLLASDTIKLNGTIDVSGRGFLGGDTIPNEYTGTCVNFGSDGWYLYESGSDSAGLKGEGIVYEGFPFVRGNGFVANAGGGGNGQYSGGGGGGNIGVGGVGGFQEEGCGDTPNPLVQGGYIKSNFYTNTGQYKNRIFMGGGGGAGTMNRPDGKIGTKGGNGGGFVILLAQTLYSNNALITASGQSVTDTATAGAGGGGGGGVVVLAVDNYIGDLNIEVSGGNGGWTNDPINRTGPGGLGGGGVIWHSGESLPLNVYTNTSNGEQGQWTDNAGGGEYYGTGTSSLSGEVLDSLIVPIRGFTFNILFGTEDICEGEAPDTIRASQPKGDTEFNFTWLQWREATGWTDADGVKDQKDYFPGVLTDTTHYRRVVEAVNNGTVDTSEVYKVNVLDALYNNAIKSSDTICYGLAPAPLVQDAPSVGGGNGEDYGYIWESRTNSSGWTPAGVTTQNYAPGPLTDTTHFRRILYSHVCYDTSNVLTQTVLSPIGGNTAAGNDAVICHDEDPGTILAGSVSGGEPGVYAYLWEMSNDLSSWTGVGDTEDLSPGSLPDDEAFYYYRRTVYSGGNDSTCRDVSDTVTIQVQPRLEFYGIQPANDTVCEDIPPGALSPAGVITGGDGIYHYDWEKSTDESDWSITGATDTLALYAVPPLSLTTWFRRIVSSGACIDTSANSKYLVHPKINNNLVADNDTVCYGEQPSALVQDAPAVSGGLGPGTYAYLWQSRMNSSPWTAAGGTNDQPGYTPGNLTDTTYYQRVIESGKCSDTSNLIQVIVQDDIGNNIIEGGSATGDVCENLSKHITGAQPSGGDESLYAYLWQNSPAGSGVWADAPVGNTGMSYDTEELIDTTDYRRLVTSGACRDTSSAVTVLVHPRPQGSITADPGLVECYYGTDPVLLDVAVDFPAGKPPFDIYYNDGNNAGVKTGFGLTSGVFTLGLTPDDSTQYTVVLDSLVDGNGCRSYHPDSLPGTASALVFRYPVPVLIDDTVSVCDSSVMLSVNQDVGEGSWGPADGNFSFVPSDQPVTVFSTSFTNDTLFYTVTWSESNGVCPVNDTSVVMVVELYEPPEPADAGMDSTIYFASSARLWAAPATAGLGTWTVTGDAVIDPAEIHLPGAGIDLGDTDLDVTVENTFTWSITNGICPANESSVTITRRDIKLFSGFSPNGDLFNEYLEFPGLEYADEFTLNIFTRQGVIIRTISKSAGDDFVTPGMWWDGLLENGQEAVDGTYFYVLLVKYAGQTYEYKGFVELVRSGYTN